MYLQVFQSVPFLGWRLEAKQGRDSKTSSLRIAFKYQWNFRLHAIVILKFGETPTEHTHFFEEIMLSFYGKIGEPPPEEGS